MRLLTFPLLLLLASCSNDKPASPGTGNSGKPQIYTTFYPTQYFTQRIAGDFADVVCPVPGDEDAIFWKPEKEDLSRYQSADMIILNGAGFAQWVDKANLPESRVVNTAESFKSEFITYEHAVKHSHGDSGEHSHEGLDGHTWVDPVNAKIQAEAIKDALVKKWPDETERFESGFAALAADLDALASDVKEISNKTPLLASHPAYNYIARRYGWDVHNLDLDPEEMPSDKTFAEIRKVLAGHPAGFLLWEGEPTEEIAARVEQELGIKNYVFSPCELAPESGDYLSVMKENVETLRKAFTQQPVQAPVPESSPSIP